jgi:CDP-diglyceride synthetase
VVCFRVIPQLDHVIFARFKDSVVNVAEQACVCGRMLGRLRWPGTKRTVEGSLAGVCFLLCILDLLSPHTPATGFVAMVISLKLLFHWTGAPELPVWAYPEYSWLAHLAAVAVVARLSRFHHHTRGLQHADRQSVRC